MKHRVDELGCVAFFRKTFIGKLCYPDQMLTLANQANVSRETFYKE